MANLGYIQLTRICNQKCLFCSNPTNGRVMPFEEACEKVDDLAAREYLGAILTGGEPTLADYLPELIKYCCNKGVHPRIISNGQRLAEPKYVTSLIESGLDHVHISLYSYKADIQNYLADKKDSFQNIEKALTNLSKYPITLHINTVINAYNADHLDETVKWLKENYPIVNHIVWNNLDPYLNRTMSHVHTIPKFRDFEISLLKATRFLTKNRISFRVERVPLCYMTEFAHCSTETRKIVKEEERLIHFLDFKGTYWQDAFQHEKPPCCKVCTLNPICGGVHCLDEFFSSDEIYPVFVSPEPIIKRIKTDPMP